MKRLFTFGCSYTSYSWPTWANILQAEFDESQNWGFSGIGNRGIAERVAECHVKNIFTPDDVVIVQWSTHLRNDWFSMTSLPERGPGWKTSGSIFNYLNDTIYDKKWVNTFFYEPAYIMHTLNNIVLVQQLLESIGCTWYMTSIGDIRELGYDTVQGTNHKETTEIINYVDVTTKGNMAWRLVPELMVYNKLIWEDRACNWLMPLNLCSQTRPELSYSFIDESGNEFVEAHPSVAQHIIWLQQELTEKLNISQTTIDMGNQIVDNIDVLHRKFKTNKRAFDVALRTKSLYSGNVNFIWPGLKQGF